MLNPNYHRRIPKGSTLKRPFGVTASRASSWSKLKATTEGGKSGKKKKRRRLPKKKSAPPPKASSGEEKAKKKEEVMKQLRAKLGDKNQSEKDSGLLDKLNPFQAGQNFRQTVGRLRTLGTGLSTETKQKYYLDDRFLEGSSDGILTERNPSLERLEQDSYVPEVLAVGATGDVGRLVVRRLLLEGRFRVRVLVRDLYSQTLNLLGTGVTYCQGDLNNMESLEYALTDVDKIVFCAGAPRPDESDFQKKFEYFMKENLDEEPNIGEEKFAVNDMEWEQLSSVQEVRAQLAEQVDCIGMQNLVTAYQNVRHADFGTSQAAKRSLFKFSGRPEDFKLFTIDDDSGIVSSDEIEESANDIEVSAEKKRAEFDYYGEDEDFDEDPSTNYYGGEYDDYGDDEYYDIEKQEGNTVKSQVQWIRNDFGHGVFVGRVPKATSSGIGGEAAIVSSRLRSREEPENGIDLSAGFAGFIVRLCGDGSKYEAFIRTGAYEKHGIEYVCEFSTQTKRTSLNNKSRNKFITERLPFDKFIPVLRKEKRGVGDPVVPAFKGEDVRFIGFRYRSEGNEDRAKLQEGENSAFYLALAFVKVYRVQPEPEFVYLSDARIPPVIKNGMIRHESRHLLVGGPPKDENDVVPILDEKVLRNVNELERSNEEIYYKFRGEEILKKSGLR